MSNSHLWQEITGDDVPGFWRQAAYGFAGVLMLFAVMRRFRLK